MTNDILYWENVSDNDNDDATLEEKIRKLVRNGWNIISICVIESTTNGIKERPTKAIIICNRN